FSFEKPLIGFLAAAFLSTVLSWIMHASLRPGLLFEGTRVWVFTLINCVIALYLPSLFVTPVGENPKPLSIWTDIILSLLWSACWLGFHTMKDPDPQALIWDTYGGFLWGLALVYALRRVRHGEGLEFLHLIFAVAFVAG